MYKIHQKNFFSFTEVILHENKSEKLPSKNTYTRRLTSNFRPWTVKTLDETLSHN